MKLIITICALLFTSLSGFSMGDGDKWSASNIQPQAAVQMRTIFETSIAYTNSQMNEAASKLGIEVPEENQVTVIEFDFIENSCFLYSEQSDLQHAAKYDEQIHRYKCKFNAKLNTGKIYINEELPVVFYESKL